MAEISERIGVVVSGARGRMGSETVRAVEAEDDMFVAAEVDQGDSLTDALSSTKAAAMVDFSVPSAVFANVAAALQCGVVPIVGTTGMTPENLEAISELCRANNTGALVAPNFAIGALLMMRFAAEAARFMPDVEVLEMHHERKLDAPSGTAVKTAELIAAARKDVARTALPEGAYESHPGARGGDVNSVPVHSMRLPGFVASQMAIFGGTGQTLTIRHDTIDRKSFMPGVVLAVRHAAALKNNGGKLVYGLDNLLW